MTLLVLAIGPNGLGLDSGRSTGGGVGRKKGGAKKATKKTSGKKKSAGKKSAK